MLAPGPMHLHVNWGNVFLRHDTYHSYKLNEALSPDSLPFRNFLDEGVWRMAMQVKISLALPDPRRQPVIAYSINVLRERVWDTTVPRFVLAPPELGWAIIG